jgi:hypothetical protein
MATTIKSWKTLTWSALAIKANNPNEALHWYDNAQQNESQTRFGLLGIDGCAVADAIHDSWKLSPASIATSSQNQNANEKRPPAKSPSEHSEARTWNH